MKYKKYIVLITVGGYEIRLDEVEYHRDLLSEDELRHKRSNIDGGGMYSILEDEKKIVFYDSSSDFGRPKNLKEALQFNGFKVLERLQEIAELKGENIDFTGYTFVEVDAAYERHEIRPLTKEEILQRQNARRYEMPEQAKYVPDFSIRHSKNRAGARQKPKNAAKKKKAKRRQSKKCYH